MALEKSPIFSENTCTSRCGASVLWTLKKDGGKKFSINYRILIKNRCPLSRIDDLFDHLGGAIAFFKLDFKSA